MSSTDETVILRVTKPAPKPEQVHVWMVAHGWVEEVAPPATAGGMGGGLLNLVETWRDYWRPGDILGVPQRWGRGGFRSAMSETLASLATVHGMSQVDLYADIMREEATHAAD